ncbi:hypothetical protein CCUG62472_02555 [Mycobacteroides salmoniphilum]|nr:hypothetical protein CCUG62472_02555 [Mycobacteroides salmoniphilum]
MDRVVSSRKGPSGLTDITSVWRAAPQSRGGVTLGA